MPKINSINFGGIWIGIALVIGVVLPGVIWGIFGVFLGELSIIGGIILLGFFIVFLIEMRQDHGKIKYYEKHIREDIPFDSEKQIAVIKSSICTGEQVAGFKNKEDGHFTEVMLIRSTSDLERFKNIYEIAEVKKEY